MRYYLLVWRQKEGVFVLLTLTGPSGSGKTTVANRCLEYSKNFQMVPSSTTRQRRLGDLPNEYHYVSKEKFATLKKRNAFLWDVTHADNSYGTLAESVIAAAIENDLCYTGIMILVPAVLPRLHAFLGSFNKTEILKPVFLEISDPRILFERMLQRGEDPFVATRRLNQEATWQQEARASSMYHFVDAEQSIDDVLQSVLSLLSQFKAS